MNESRFSDNDAHSIGEVFGRVLESCNLSTQFHEGQVIAAWERLLGKNVSDHTKRIFLKNKTLFVELDSPSLKHDLNLSKKHVILLITNDFGKEVISDLVIM